MSAVASCDTLQSRDRGYLALQPQPCAPTDCRLGKDVCRATCSLSSSSGWQRLRIRPKCVKWAGNSHPRCRRITVHDDPELVCSSQHSRIILRPSNALSHQVGFHPIHARCYVSDRIRCHGSMLNEKVTPLESTLFTHGSQLEASTSFQTRDGISPSLPFSNGSHRNSLPIIIPRYPVNRTRCSQLQASCCGEPSSAMSPTHRFLENARNEQRTFGTVHSIVDR